jgi:hypothetical protein
MPALVATLHIDLNEGAGQLLLFPRRGRLARLEPHDHVLPPRRLAGVKGDAADDAVALVEDGEDGDALRHGRHARLIGVGGPVRRARLVLLLAAAPAGGEREREDQRRRWLEHAYSGIHGS